MGKVKTHKSLAKRVRRTKKGKGKLIHDKFQNRNSRFSRNTNKRAKNKSLTFAKTVRRRVKNLLQN